MDTRCLRRVEQAGAIFEFDLSSIYRKHDHAVTPSFVPSLSDTRWDGSERLASMSTLRSSPGCMVGMEACLRSFASRRGSIADRTAKGVIALRRSEFASVVLPAL
jgi:hypothetical protein